VDEFTKALKMNWMTGVAFIASCSVKTKPYGFPMRCHLQMSLHAPSLERKLTRTGFHCLRLAW
jgi:hypothetical protein